MELWLIRHGLPVRIDGGNGPADPDLAPEGVNQAEAMAAWWSRHGLDAIYASPMARAHQTAIPLGEATGLEVTLDDGLKEFDAHLDFYVPLEELRQDEQAWKRVIDEWMSPEAEAQRKVFRSEVTATIDAISDRHRGHRVAVVCHGGVINSYLSDVLSMEATMWFEPAYTSVSRSLSAGGDRRIVSLNETPHLAQLVQPSALL